MFQLSEKPLDPETLKHELRDPHAGACVTFEGWVRDHSDGRAVAALSYEAYVELAVAEGTRIMEEARSKFEVIEDHCVHRIGDLAIGELAVWVGVSAAHRDAAFAACRYVIDEIKARVPIWKHEAYREGDRQWVNAGTNQT